MSYVKDMNKLSNIGVRGARQAEPPRATRSQPEFTRIFWEKTGAHFFGKKAGTDCFCARFFVFVCQLFCFCVEHRHIRFMTMCIYTKINTYNIHTYIYSQIYTHSHTHIHVYI